MKSGFWQFRNTPEAALGPYFWGRTEEGVTRCRHCINVRNLTWTECWGERTCRCGEMQSSEKIRLPIKSPTRFVTTLREQVQTLWHLVEFLKLQHHHRCSVKMHYIYFRPSDLWLPLIWGDLQTPVWELLFEQLFRILSFHWKTPPTLEAGEKHLKK